MEAPCGPISVPAPSYVIEYFVIHWCDPQSNTLVPEMVASNLFVILIALRQHYYWPILESVLSKFAADHEPPRCRLNADTKWMLIAEQVQQPEALWVGHHTCSKVVGSQTGWGRAVLYPGGVGGVS